MNLEIHPYVGVEAAEFFPPACPMYKGWPFFGKSYTEVKEQVLGYDAKAEEDDSGVTSYTLGISIYSSAAKKEPDEPIESVLVFAKDYYD